jgi:hypothetical protein
VRERGYDLPLEDQYSRREQLLSTQIQEREKQLRIKELFQEVREVEVLNPRQAKILRDQIQVQLDAGSTPTLDEVRNWRVVITGFTPKPVAPLGRAPAVEYKATQRKIVFDEVV